MKPMTPSYNISAEKPPEDVQQSINAMSDELKKAQELLQHVNERMQIALKAYIKPQPLGQHKISMAKSQTDNMTDQTMNAVVSRLLTGTDHTNFSDKVFSIEAEYSLTLSIKNKLLKLGEVLQQYSQVSSNNSMQCLASCMQMCKELDKLYKHRDILLASGALLIASGSIVAAFASTTLAITGVGAVLLGIVMVSVALKKQFEIRGLQVIDDGCKQCLNSFGDEMDKISSSSAVSNDTFALINKIFSQLSSLQQMVAKIYPDMAPQQ